MATAYMHARLAAAALFSALKKLIVMAMRVIARAAGIARCRDFMACGGQEQVDLVHGKRDLIRYRAAYGPGGNLASANERP